MLTRIKIALLLLLAPLLLAQEEGDTKILRVYDVSALAPRRERFVDDEGRSSDPEFAPLGMTSALARQYEALWMDTSNLDRIDPCDALTELLGSVTEGETPVITPEDEGRLLVWATPKDHERILGVLASLRSGVVAPVHLEVRHISLEAGEKTAEMLRELASGGVGDDLLARLLASDRYRGTRVGSISVPQGRWSCFRALRSVRYLPEYDVEIAQASSIADPVPSVVTDGFKVALRPLVTMDGRIVLRVIASAGDLDPQFRRFDMRHAERSENLRLRETDFGTVEQCDFRGCAASTEVMLSKSAPNAILLSAPEASGSSRLDLMLFRAIEAPKAMEPASIMVLPLGGLHAKDMTREVRWSERGELVLLPKDGETEQSGRLELEQLKGLVDEPTDARVITQFHVGEVGSLLVQATPEIAKEVHGALASLERQMLDSLRLRIELRSEGEQSRTVGRLVGPLLTGRRAAFAGYHKLDYTGDHDVEVAQESRIADPIHLVATEGTFVNARVDDLGDGWYRLDLYLKVSCFREALREITPETGGVPLIQSVPVEERSVRLVLELADGGEQDIELGPSPFDPPGRARLVARIALDQG